MIRHRIGIAAGTEFGLSYCLSVARFLLRCKLFGDEMRDYGESIASHYANGAPSDWRDNYISAYASSHPHEDWAESFAHYLHIYDTLETARERNVIEANPDPSTEFHAWIGSWLQLSIDLNVLARSMGYRDLYPFVLTPRIIDKLQFVHTAISSAVNSD